MKNFMNLSLHFMRNRQKAMAYMLTAMLAAASMPTQILAQSKNSEESYFLNETKNTEETEAQSTEKVEETTTQAQKDTDSTDQTTASENTENITEASTQGEEATQVEAATQEPEDSSPKKEETTDKKEKTSKNEKDGDSAEKEIAEEDAAAEETEETAQIPVDYSMPTAISEGYTNFQQQKTKKFERKLKKILKNIQTLKQTISLYQEQIKKVGQLYIDIENNMEDGETLAAYLVGTTRTKVNAKKTTTISGLDEALKETAAALSSKELTAWVESYTLEQTYVPVDLDLEQSCVSDLEQSVLDGASSVMPVLKEVVQEKKEAIRTANAAIAKNKEQRKQLNQKIKQTKTKRVFDPTDVTLASGITKAEARQILKDTNMEFLAPTFVECEKVYHINAVFLMAVAAHESDWGKSRRAVEDHNYTGYGIYDGITFTSGEECIQVTANALAVHYLTPVGKYYEGTAVCDVHKKYCATGGWSNSVVNTAYKMLETIYH